MGLLAGCDSGGAVEFSEVGVDCSGKCDGLGSSIRSLWDKARRVDRGDLVNVTAGLATDQLNDALAFDNVAVGFDAPELYALEADAEGDLTVHDLDALTSGLAYRYGERELSTAVNRVRQRHLEASGDEVFAEAAFQISAEFDHGWNFQTGGLSEDGGDGRVSIGFTAGAEVESRVIGAFGNEIRSNGSAMLQALQESRGFILPRSVDDIRDLSPGESIALSGDGALGVNIGAGVPLIIAEPTAGLTYNIIVSGALRARLEGHLDIQLVRMEGDDVYIDVGTSRIFTKSAQLAIRDGWGVTGFIEAEVDIAGQTVDLGRIVEKALQKQLNRQINLIDGRLERSGRESRLSVARIRFDLDELTGDGEEALQQLLKGDIRLAQLLSNEGEPGVHAEFDMLRTGESTTGYAGIDLLGMKFFSETIESSGTTIVQTPGGARSLMFDSLHNEGGWFFSSHGYTRVGLSGLVWDPRVAAAPTGEANLFIQVVEGDGYMQRDKLLDHVDAMLIALAGPDAFAILETYGNDLERHTESLCSPGSRAGSACFEDVLADAETIRLRADGLAAFTAEIGGLSTSQRVLVTEAAELRLTSQATVEIAASLTGPESAVVTDYRLDDRALNQLLLEHTGEELAAAVHAYLQVAEIRRDVGETELAADRAEVVTDNGIDVAALAAIFDLARENYEAVTSAENATLDGFGQIGANAMEIRFAVDRDGAVDYESATTQSLAQARAAVATALYDDLVASADDLPGYPEQVIAYSFLALTPEASQDLRVDIDFDTSDWVYDHYGVAGYTAFDSYALGGEVSPIDGGLFILDSLLKVD
ncbi:MAG: hypothetical protein DRJ42_13185 [Deltaproteobacteria bacterium]|nr:MAG: hypothetical protein DRJ42_13185 [Deltaproteobacteria bacterium]